LMVGQLCAFSAEVSRTNAERLGGSSAANALARIPKGEEPFGEGLGQSPNCTAGAKLLTAVILLRTAVYPAQCGNINRRYITLLRKTPQTKDQQKAEVPAPNRRFNCTEERSDFRATRVPAVSSNQRLSCNEAAPAITQKKTSDTMRIGSLCYNFIKKPITSVTARYISRIRQQNGLRRIFPRRRCS